MTKFYLKMSYITIKSKFNRRLKYKEDQRVDIFIPLVCTAVNLTDRHLNYKNDLGVDSLFCF